MQERIEVNIDAAGGITVQAQGVNGSGCTALTQALERELGSVTQDEKTAEYHRAAQSGQRQQQKG